jgi:pimeloyl-ACP methyl ester carboxylesterase
MPRFTVVLLPGLACDAVLLQAQHGALSSRGHRVLVADVHTRCDTLPAMARTLLAEVRGPLVLVGASMGGMVALEAARQAPARIRGLALLGTSARADPPEAIALRTRACEYFAAGRVDEVLDANLMLAFHPLHAANAAMVRSYRAMVGRAGAQQLIRQNRAVMAREDLRPFLPGMRMPALVVCGEADRLTPPEQAREIAALLPQSRLEIVPGAGHLLTMEEPARVNALLLDGLDRLSA